MVDQRNEEITLLLYKCLTGKASEKEYEEAYHWVHLNGENAAYFDTLYQLWFAAGMKRQANPALQEQVWMKLKARVNIKPEKHRINVKWLRIAAMLAAAISLGYFLRMFFTDDIGVAHYTVEAPKGAKSIVTMADGSRVMLNAGSKIFYTSEYNVNNRELALTGEAFFEVAKNKAKPFRVKAGGIVINALGTAFNVKAYPGEGRVETTLVEGLVSIEKTGRGANQEPILLKPNQQAIYYKTKAEQLAEAKKTGEPHTDNIALQKPLPEKQGRILLTPEVKTEVFTSWKDKRWIFQNEPFGAFATKLERIYDVSIVIEDAELINYKLTGSIEEDNIEMVLSALQLIIPIDYKFERKQIVIRLNDELKRDFDQALKKTNQ